ncbi:MAG: hypothetical protein WA947_18205 [Phormidesmis sp.]
MSIMTAATFSTSVEAQQAAALLASYQFELGGHDARQWVSLWLEFYRPAWIRDAVIEALYQGRYKSVSVRQILELWNRRGQPIRHVTHEFEAAVCREFGEVKLAATALPQDQRRKANIGSIRRSKHTSAKNTSAKNTSARSTPAKNSPTHHLSSLKDSIHKAGQASFAPTAAVSFDLSETPPGMAPMAVQPEDFGIANQSEVAAAKPAVELLVQPSGKSSGKPATTELERSLRPETNPSIDNGNESYRKVSRSAIQSPAETEALLRTQRQLNGVLYTSARAIQPFKPALPFSAQTLRLARQKTLA